MDLKPTKNRKKQKELAVLELSGNRAGIVVATNTISSTYAIVFVVESDEKSFFSTIGEPLNFKLS